MRIAQVALDAIQHGTFETKSGYCSRFVRQVVEHCYGTRFSYLFGASALNTAHNFKQHGYAWNAAHIELREGDILFKTQAGQFGHVGIFVGPRGVAENSSTSLGRVRGALGFRTLAQYGKFNLVGRIPIN